MSDNLNILYNDLRRDYGQNFTKSFEEFQNDMGDGSIRKQLYNNLKRDYGQNFTKNFEEFETDMGFGAKDKGFWGSWTGDLLEGIGGTALSMAGNTADFFNRLQPKNIMTELAMRKTYGNKKGYEIAEELRKKRAENEISPSALAKRVADPLKEKGSELSERSYDYYGQTVDEDGNVRNKDFADLWKEGNKAGAIGNILLEGGKSLPTSAVAFTPVGIPVIAASSANEKYDEVSRNSDLGMGASAVNATLTGAFETLTEKIGAGIEKGILRNIVKKEGKEKAVDTVKGLILNYLKSQPKEIATEGLEEGINAAAVGIVDYATSMSDKAFDWEEILKSGVYGAGGGAMGGATFGGVTTAAGVPIVRENNKKLKQINDVLDNAKKQTQDNINSIADDVVSPEFAEEVNVNDVNIHIGAANRMNELADGVKAAFADSDVRINTGAIAETYSVEQLREEAVNVIGAENLTDDQKSAVLSFLEGVAVQRKLGTMREDSLQEHLLTTRGELEKHRNDKSGTLVTGVVKGSGIEAPLQIVGGLALKEDANGDRIVDIEGSDDAIYYLDTHGRTQATTASDISFDEELNVDAVLSEMEREWRERIAEMDDIVRDESGKVQEGSGKIQEDASTTLSDLNDEGSENDLNNANIQPVGVGVFGNIYDQFKGKARQAIAFLMNKKEGIAVNALSHKDIGGIDLVWGTDKYGLKKIAEKHPEMLDDMQGKIDGMEVMSSSDNRIILESGTHKAVISHKLGDTETDQWLLTAYEKKNTASASSSDNETELNKSKRIDTAPPQNDVSIDKGSEKGLNNASVVELSPLEEFTKYAELDVDIAREMMLEKSKELKRQANNLRKRKADNMGVRFENLMEAKRLAELSAEYSAVANNKQAREDGVSWREKKEQALNVDSGQLSLRGLIAQYFLGGGKMNVADYEREFGKSFQGAERKQRIRLLGKDAPAIDRLEEMLLEEYGSERADGIRDDINAFRNALLDVMQSSHSADALADLVLAERDNLEEREAEYAEAREMERRDTIAGLVRAGYSQEEAEAILNQDESGKIQEDASSISTGSMTEDPFGVEDVSDDMEVLFSKQSVGNNVDSPVGEFVLTKNSKSDVYGYIRKDTGLKEAPIKLTKERYKHIEDRHGKQIRNAGFDSVEEFVETVAQNYSQIKEGVNRFDEPNGTYLVQVKDKYNNTLYVELSADGKYWGVNSAGVFRSQYGDRLKTVWSASEVQNRKSTSDNTLRSDARVDNTPNPNGNVSNTDDKDSKKDFENANVETQDIDKVNSTFNEELATLTDENADSKYLYLGAPSAILQSAGISNKPLKLHGSKLRAKSKKHGFNYTDIKDLPKAVSSPIAVFKNLDREGNFSILTELDIKGNNVLVAVDFGKDLEVDFNVVSSVFGKSGNGIVNWINKGYSRYIDKEKALDYLQHKSAPIAAASSKEELVSATKVIKDFENPSIETQGIASVRDGVERPVFKGDIADYAKNMVTLNKLKEVSDRVDANPSEAQKLAGNYTKGHINIQGFDITIENPKGSRRSGIDANGKEWSIVMQNDYGYFKRTVGKDGDHIDVFIGSNPESKKIFVIDQIDTNTKEFDESKVMLGFEDMETAKSAYMSNYEENWQGLGRITETDSESFKKWLYDGAKQRKAFSEYKENQPQDAVKRKIAEIQAKSKNPIRVEFVDTEGLPARVRNHKDFGSNWDALKYGKVVYMRKGLVNTEAEAVAKWIHEVGVHSGIFHILPNEEQRNELMGRVWDSAKELAKSDATYAGIVAHIEQNYNSNEAHEKGNEVLAYLAEKIVSEQDLTEADKTLWQKIVEAFRGALTKLYGKGSDLLTDNEIKDIVFASVQSNFQNNELQGERGKLQDARLKIKEESRKKKEDDTRFSLLDKSDFDKEGNVKKEVLAEISAEKESIVKQAKADGTYLKAPNGKATKLNEEQWVLTRTKRFKKWFGDWEKSARIEKLKEADNVVITEKDYKGKYELNRDSAKQYMKDNLRGTYTNKDTGNKVQMVRTGIDKVTSHDERNPAHLKSIVAIPRMLEDAIFIEEQKNEKGNNKFDSYQYYVAGLKIDNVDYTAKIVVGVKDGSRFYDHTLTQIEKGTLINDKSRIAKTEAIDKNTLSDYKDTRLLDILKTNSSKVVDENNEPLVVFHGTDAEFTAFNYDNYGKNGVLSGKGINLTANRRIAEKYSKGKTPVIMELFVDLRNPYNGISEIIDADLREKIWTTEGAFDEVLKQNGFDGKGSYDDKFSAFLVFSPNQIKSATANTGEFSSENDDIRFSKRPVYDGGSIGDYAKRVNEWNKEHRFDFNLNVSDIPAPPVLSADMGLGEMAQKVDAFNKSKRKVLAEVNREMERLSGFYTKHIDKARPLEKYLMQMADYGAVFGDDMDAYQAFINSNSQAQYVIKEYNRNVLMPLTEHCRVVLDGLTDGGSAYRWNIVDNDTGAVLNDKLIDGYDRLSLYLQAKDIVEAEELGLVDRGTKGFEENVRNAAGDGVRAVDYVAEFEREVGSDAIDRLWGLVRASNKWALDVQLEHGLIGNEVYDEYVNGERKYYVPQRGWRERDLAGRSFHYVENVGSSPDNPFNTALVKAKGRSSLAGDPLAYMQSIAESSVMSAFKNKTKQKFLAFAEANADFARVYKFFTFQRAYYVNTGKLDEDGNALYERSYERPDDAVFESDERLANEIKGVDKEIAGLKKLYANGTVDRMEYAKRSNALIDKRTALRNKIQVKYVGSESERLGQRTAAEKKQHVVTVLRGGKEYDLQFGDKYGGERVANVLNRNFKKRDYDPKAKVRTGEGIDVFLDDAWNWGTQNGEMGIYKATRFMSAMMTQYFPAFAATNFARDMWAASITNMTEQGMGYQLDFMKNMGKSSGTVLEYVWNDVWDTGKDFPDSEMGGLLREFFEDGAATGWSFLKDVDQLRKDLKRSIDPKAMDAFVHGKFGTQNVFGLKQALGFLTEASELSVRFAVYATSREQKNADGSPKFTRQQCATHSKEATTNFDRKGSSVFLSSLFAFFNAAIQGVNKYFRALKKSPQVRAGLKTAFAMHLVGGFMQGLLMPDPDDPDERLFSEWELMTNLCIGKFKLPLSQVFRGFWGVGTQMALCYRGRKSVGDCVLDGTKFFLGEMLPEQVMALVDGVEIDERSGHLSYNPKMAVRGIVPTAIQPLYDVATNTNFLGNEIYYTPFMKRQEGKLAQRTLGKRNVAPMAQKFADTMARIGGSDLSDKSLYKSDMSGMIHPFFDVNPSKVEYLVRGYSAGTGGFFVDMYTLADQMIDPEKRIDFSQTGVGNRFWKQPKGYSNIDMKMWKLKDVVEFHEDGFKMLGKGKDSDGTARRAKMESLNEFSTRDALMRKRNNPSRFYRELMESDNRMGALNHVIRYDYRDVRDSIRNDMLVGRDAERALDRVTRMVEKLR